MTSPLVDCGGGKGKGREGALPNLYTVCTVYMYKYFLVYSTVQYKSTVLYSLQKTVLNKENEEQKLCNFFCHKI